MSFEIYEENDAMLKAIHGVITKDIPTDTRWMTEEEMVKHHDDVKARNAVIITEVKYSQVFDILAKEIFETVDTKHKNALETLCHVLINSKDKEDIVSESIIKRVNKMLNREVLKESAVEVLREAASSMKVMIPVSKKIGSYGDDIAEAVFDKIDEGSFDFSSHGGRNSFTTEHFGWDAKKQEFTLTASTEPIDVKRLGSAANEISDFIEEEFGLSNKIFGKPKFK